jgi:hypothetical protein
MLNTRVQLRWRQVLHYLPKRGDCHLKNILYGTFLMGGYFVSRQSGYFGDNAATDLQFLVFLQPSEIPWQCRATRVSRKSLECHWTWFLSTPEIIPEIKPQVCLLKH